MSAEEFQRLPLMVSRRQVLAVTGWAKGTFYKHVNAGALKPVMQTPGGHQRFRKLDLKFLLSS
jgi:predicted DNA-binding transcriptional regulator AlpA